MSTENNDQHGIDIFTSQIKEEQPQVAEAAHGNQNENFSPTSNHKIFPSFEFLIFYLVKFTCIVCLITTLTLMCSACVNNTLQIIFVIENGYEKYNDGDAAGIWYLRWFQSLFLPNLLILWGLFCAYILSRQMELIYLVYLTPYYSKLAVMNLLNDQGYFQLSHLMLMPINEYFGGVVQWKNFVTPTAQKVIVGITMSIALILFMIKVTYGVVFMLWVGSFHIIVTCFSVDAPIIFCLESFFVIVAAIASSIWMVSSYSFYPESTYDKFVLMFSTISTIVSACYIFYEVWCVPTAMLFLSDPSGNIPEETIFTKYLPDAIKNYVTQKNPTDDNALHQSKRISYYYLSAFLSFCFIGCVVLISLSISLSCFLRRSQMTIDYNARMTAAWSLIILTLSALIVFAVTSIKQNPARHSIVGAMIYAVMNCSEWIKSLSSRELIVEKWKNENRAFYTTFTTVMKYWFALFFWLFHALLAGQYLIVSTNWYVGSANAGIYWFGAFLALLSFFFQDVMIVYIFVMFAMFCYYCSFSSAVYILLVFTNGCVLLRNYFLLDFTKPQLDALNEEEKKKLIRERTVEVSDMNAYYYNITTFFQHKVNLLRISDPSQDIEKKDTNDKKKSSSDRIKKIQRSIIEYGFSPLPQQDISNNQDDFDEYEKFVQSKGSRRLYVVVYVAFMILHFILYVLAIWAQEIDSPYSQTKGKPLVYSEDIKVDKQLTPYPICYLDYFTLSIVDLSFLTEMTYFKDPLDADVDCGRGGNTTKLETCLKHYFTSDYMKASLNNKPYDWKVQKIAVPRNNQQTTLREHASYYGISSDSAKLFVVGVRGSSTGRDWLEDFTLYAEVSTFQLVSSIIPLVYVWPTESVALTVNTMSYMASLSFLQRNPYSNRGFLIASYYSQVIDYVHSVQATYPDYQVIVIGHSLGGATAGIVGAKANISSFGFEPPGLVLSKIKFDVPGGTQRIYSTSTNIVRQFDPVPMVDVQGGDTQRITCPTEQLNTYCHLMHPITCHLLANCERMNNSINFRHWGGTYEYCTS